MNTAYQHLDDHQSMLALWYVVNTSLVSYYKLVNAFGSAKTALSGSQSAWRQLSIHASHIKRLGDASDVLAFIDQVHDDVARKAYSLLFFGENNYPSQLTELYDPPPVLFYRGNVTRLSDRQIAIVGSRKPSEYAQKVTFDLAQYLVQSGFSITSGLAQGVDRAAHLGALTQAQGLLGRTVGVTGTGVDVCYPKNHHALFAQIIQDGGCLVSELLPHTPASKHTFPRRNRLVAGLSIATVVTEAAIQSGSLITARLAAEQGKQVFALPNNIYHANTEGCHHLIREGATLIYHPNHILEDINNHTQVPFNNLPKTFSKGDTTNATAKTNTQPNEQWTNDLPLPPEHLLDVLSYILADGVDLDRLVVMTKLDAGTLLAKLMELEVLGFITQKGGLYVKL
ncbi:DNA-processing protein DprA [Moraxella nasovis]|uniref:DNA-processing protein DprA n=1 Tax=Moraxella nasovis TaxID=2904121 RepID=UPI001F606C22|nr:DNA-processing protein DprA [Moraxella nasovis]UNU72507.1 DNA-processing protein DprA [Moraxella nasovis]